MDNKPKDNTAYILWPDECGKEAVDQDKIYQQLLYEYKMNEFEDYDDRAYQDAYESTGITAQMNTLIKRVDDKKKRVFKMLEYYHEDER